MLDPALAIRSPGLYVDSLGLFRTLKFHLSLYFLFKKIFIVYLAALGLSCGTRDLYLWRVNS